MEWQIPVTLSRTLMLTLHPLDTIGHVKAFACTPLPTPHQHDFLSTQVVEAFAYAARPLPPKTTNIGNFKARVVQLTGVERHRLRCFPTNTWTELPDSTTLWCGGIREEHPLLELPS